MAVINMKRSSINITERQAEACTTNMISLVVHISVCRLLAFLSLLTAFISIAPASSAEEIPLLYGKDTLAADIGTLLVGENRNVSYSVTNTTDKLLIIEEVESTCDCMTVLEYPSQIAPQGEEKVLINLFGEEEGKYAFAVALQFNNGSQRYLVAQVSVKEAEAKEKARPEATMVPPRVGKKWYPGKPKPIAPEVMRRITRYSENSLYTTLNDVQSSVRKRAVRVIDLRSAESFRQCRLPGSLNMTPVEARTKSFLRKGHVLLVDEGWGRKDTERACIAIRKAGNSDCHILFGGINAWVHNGNRTEGPGTAPEKLAVISPSDFLSVRGLDTWVVLDDKKTSFERTRKWLPETVAGLPDFKNSPKRLLLLGKNKNTLKNLPENAVLFSLKGGIAAIEKEYRRMTAMRYTQTRTTSSRISAKRWQILKSGCGCGG